jgi:hypothetical protein
MVQANVGQKTLKSNIFKSFLPRTLLYIFSLM